MAKMQLQLHNVACVPCYASQLPCGMMFVYTTAASLVSLPGGLSYKCCIGYLCEGACHSRSLATEC